MESVIKKSRSSKKQFSFISIIIPFYQRNNELISLLKSLEIVEYPLKYLEIIIVQDGSKVDSDVLIIIKNSKLKIKLISNDTNLGRTRPQYNAVHPSLAGYSRSGAPSMNSDRLLSACQRDPESS